MGRKDDKRKGIPPVQVRRFLQPDENPHRKSNRSRQRWKGKYPEAIRDEVKKIRQLVKEHKARIQEHARKYRTWIEVLEEWKYDNCERSLKEGFRAAQLGMERRCPVYGNDRSILSTDKAWMEMRNAEMKYWFKGYDLGKQ